MSVTLTHKVVTVTEESETIPHHEMLERLHASILAHGPHHFDMATWMTVRDEDGDPLSLELSDIANSPKVDVSHCGTTGCFAGHATSWLRNNGAIDIVSYDKWGDGRVIAVDQDRVQNLLGVTYGSFSSSYDGWHPITVAAYMTDLATQVAGDTVRYMEDYFTDWETPKPVTPEMIIEDSSYGIDYVVQDGNVMDWADYRPEIQHHAEWVAILTYLKYVASLSRDLYYRNAGTNRHAEGDMTRIKNSPAFKNYFDEQVEAEQAARDATLESAGFIRDGEVTYVHVEDAPDVSPY